jgi:nicotinamide-nucleotide amidase
MTVRSTETGFHKFRIVAIGDELLDGFTLDTNSRQISQDLQSLGFRISGISLIRDKEAALREQFEIAENSDSAHRTITISTGGLGPTIDDRTKHILAELFSVKLVFDESRWIELLDFFEKRGRRAAPENRNQALMPSPGLNLRNGIGTANGLVFESAQQLWIALPGVPSEMAHLMQKQVLPLLEKRLASNPRRTKVLSFRSRRLPEATLHGMLEPLDDLTRIAEIGFYPNPDGVLLRLRIPPLKGSQQIDRENKLKTIVRQRLGEHLLCESGAPLVELVFAELKKKGLSLGLAESCTGGLLARQITDLNGASEVFKGGIVAYHNQLKINQLSVDESILDEFGAVSSQCVIQMSSGLQKNIGCDIALSVSGVAGPGGGTPDKPVGTVWLGMSTKDSNEARLLKLAGSREQIRKRAAGQAWVWLYEVLSEMKTIQG